MSDHETTPGEVTLTARDREAFLRARGLVPGVTPEDRAAEIRAEWPDEDILMAMELGQF